VRIGGGPALLVRPISMSELSVTSWERCQARSLTSLRRLPIIGGNLVVNRSLVEGAGSRMRRIRHGAETFGIASGETLDLRVSEPGEFVDLADFASRTILACSLVGYEIVAQASPRSLAELDRADWVAASIERFTGVVLPPPAECRLFAGVERPECLNLAIDVGRVFVAFCWDCDKGQLARHT
jgi:hypothetical protein